VEEASSDRPPDEEESSPSEESSDEERLWDATMGELDYGDKKPAWPVAAGFTARRR